MDLREMRLLEKWQTCMAFRVRYVSTTQWSDCLGLASYAVALDYL